MGNHWICMSFAGNVNLRFDAPATNGIPVPIAPTVLPNLQYANRIDVTSANLLQNSLDLSSLRTLQQISDRLLFFQVNLVDLTSFVRERNRGPDIPGTRCLNAGL